MPTLNADPTSRAANSYVTLAMANSYFDDRITSDNWTAATDDNKKRALIEAAKRIDTYRFHGTKVYYRQIMQWPRYPYSRVVSGVADAGSTNTLLIDTDLANSDLYENLDWQYAGLRIINGTNQNEARLISSFNVSTGTLTVDTIGSTVFSAALDTSSEYQLIEQIPKEVRDAQCELALWLIDQGESRNTQVDPNVKGELIGDYSVEYREGVGIDVIMPDFVRNMLDEYISAIGTYVDDRVIN